MNLKGNVINDEDICSYKAKSFLFELLPVFFFFFDSFKAYYKIGLLCLYLADALVAIQVSSLSPACLLSNLISPLKEF